MNVCRRLVNRIDEGLGLNTLYRDFVEVIKTVDGLLCVFVSAFLSNDTQCSKEVRFGNDSVWPIPLPYDVTSARKPKSARRRSRFVKERAVRILVNCMVGVLNYYHLGPKRASAEVGGFLSSGLKLKPRQNDVVSRFHEIASSFSRVDSLEFTGGRKKAPNLLKSVGFHYENDLRSVGGLAKGTPVETVAARQTLPKAGAQVKVCDWVSPETVFALRNPESIISRPLVGLPKPFINAEKGELALLYKRLFECQLLAVLSVDDVCLDENGCPVYAGVFSVTKDDDWDRLILDRRPLNSVEKVIRPCDLPHATQFCKYHLGVDELIRMNLRDASNFYYVLSMPRDVSGGGIR